MTSREQGGVFNDLYKQTSGIPDSDGSSRQAPLRKRHAPCGSGEEGKSTEEIHAIFKKVMAFDPSDIDSIPKDEAHAKYRAAMIHMQHALKNGKSSEEAHAIFKKIMAGEGSGHCPHKG